MKLKIFSVPMAIVLASLLQAAAQNRPIAGLYATGVNDDGTLAVKGTLDAHYSLVSVPPGSGQEAWIASSIPNGPPSSPGWVVISDANWLAPSADGTQAEPPGQYDYRLTLRLADASGTALDPLTASISGSWAADNEAVLLLNGIPVATNSAQFAGLTGFNISSGFRPCLNVLDFIVTNAPGPGPNPTGLLVANLAGFAQIMPPTQTRPIAGL